MGLKIQKNQQNKDFHVQVIAASQGDAHAFEALYQEFFPKISRFVVYRVSDVENAEDLVSDIFVKAWESLQNGVVIGSFQNWIFTVARNRVIDFYRTSKTTADLFELENQLHYTDRIIETIDLDLALQDFLRILPRLSPDQQQVIRLKFFEDLDNDEIAAIMEKTEGTIRVIQHRALNPIKSELEQAS